MTDRSNEQSNTRESVSVVLSNTMANEEWELDAPTDIATYLLVQKLVMETKARANDDAGNPIPYRLRWEEDDRYLSESETLEEAGVQNGHRLALAYETRAGHLHNTSG